MDEGETYQVIDRFFIEAPKSTLNQGAQIVRRTGDANVVDLGVSYELRCALNFYGEDCSKFCSPQDSDFQGHYVCDEEGDKVCLQGYEVSMKTSQELCLNTLMKLTCNYITIPFRVLLVQMLQQTFVLQIHVKTKETAPASTSVMNVCVFMASLEKTVKYRLQLLV